MLNYTFLFASILYITFIPGFIIVEKLIPKVLIYIKLPLYFILSILISTYLTYATSLLFGFNRLTITFIILFLLVLFALTLKKRFWEVVKNIQNEKYLILVSLIVYLLFFTPLNAGIFRKVNDNFIMSGPNWQDTAMHMSIIESISQGNFPPTAPYFSGELLNYYYFADLHSAIANVMYSGFFPKILVILNPFFALTMFLIVYALARYLSGSIKFAYISGILSVFYSNLGFVELIQDVFVKKTSYFNLLTNNGYHLNHETALLMVPMADYFLQNRPMMVGLPSFVAVCLLIFLSQKQKNKKLLLLSGVINALLIKFQFFGFLIGIMFYGFLSLYNLLFRRLKFKKIFVNFLIFILPSVLLLALFGLSKVGSRSLFEVVLKSFSFEGLLKEGFIWNLSFIVVNFNLPIFICLLGLFFINKFKDSNIRFVYLFTFFILTIPFVIKFTINNYDMFKFFYYAVPLISLIFGYICYFLSKKNKAYYVVSVFILIFTSLTSINLLIHAYLNKSVAYSESEYEAGLWVRKNTPPKSIFVSYPSVHNGASDIAGRPRVLSYINWPYSHGFNEGEDNVFSRLNDIETFYSDPNRIDILNKYNISYIYLSDEERSNFENSENKLESNLLLEKVYDENNIKIFRKK